MAVTEVIDLTLDDDSEEEPSPSKAVNALASFGPRKTKPQANGEYRDSRFDRPQPVPQVKSWPSLSSRPNAVTSESREDANRAPRSEPKRKEKVQRELEVENIPRAVDLDAMDTYVERIIYQNGNRLSEHHSLNHKSSLTETLQQTQSMAFPPPARNPVLSGAGLHITRAFEPPNPMTNGTKRTAAALNGEVSEAKRPRTIAREVNLVDISEQSPLERFTSSSERDLPSPKTYPPKRSPPQQKFWFQSGPSRNGIPYHAHEDSLLKKLKEVDGLDWNEVVPYFNGRTQGSLQVRYSTKLKAKDLVSQRAPPRRSFNLDHTLDHTAPGVGREKRVRTGRVRDGFISWAEVKQAKIQYQPAETTASESQDSTIEKGPEVLRQDQAYPQPVGQILRNRELGLTSRKAWTATRTTITPETLKNHVFSEYSLHKRYHGTSGDVIALSWSPQGNYFAAGSIAISDSRSMQYNMQRNLLLGDRTKSELQELIEHHIERPKIQESDNINGHHAMRESQDPRLFLTVTTTAFAPRKNSPRLYSAGNDRMVRQFTINNSSGLAECRYAIKHDAVVDLLTVGNTHGLVASGCHSATESIKIYRCSSRAYQHCGTFSPRNINTSAPTFPSALKWGTIPRYQDLLLAGFSGDGEQTAGEMCLWHAETGQAIEVHAAHKSIFDVAWNPLASSASGAFAVAATASPSDNTSKRTRSIVKCFAPTQDGGKCVVTWECPALDINDLVFCPHDDHLIAAGATDGNVYIWDIRGVDRSQHPLHILKSGNSENILAHDRDRELADTGVRFLSWGATKSRLYSGSSDGIVKVWNPYRSSAGAHVEDLQVSPRHRSAIMSGAFSHDYTDLLIGTENGAINVFSIGGTPVHREFKLRSAPPPAAEVYEPFVEARSKIASGEIEIRPCGAMPLRQAVQGPHYRGPFVAPTQQEGDEAELALQYARRAQVEARFKQAHAFDSEEEQDAVDKASQKVRDVELRITDLNDRMDHSLRAQPQAEEFQRSLRQDEKDRKALVRRLSDHIEPCRLECTVLRTEDDEVEDSGRSELRIPGALRSANKIAALCKQEEPDEACISCFPTNLLRGLRHLCLSCELKKMRLTTACSWCNGPARVDTETKPPVCENCLFSCFRCAGPSRMSENLTTVSCLDCDLVWEAGILGYELMNEAGAKSRKTTAPSKSYEDDDIGTSEREHYASLWQDAENQVVY